MYVDVLENGNVEQVLQSRLKMTVEIGVLEDAFGLLAANVEMPLKNDAILRQRTCFVGAQDVHGTEVLNCI